MTTPPWCREKVMVFYILLLLKTWQYLILDVVDDICTFFIVNYFALKTFSKLVILAFHFVSNFKTFYINAMNKYRRV